MKQCDLGMDAMIHVYTAVVKALGSGSTSQLLHGSTKMCVKWLFFGPLYNASETGNKYRGKTEGGEILHFILFVHPKVFSLSFSEGPDCPLMLKEHCIWE